VKVTVRAREDSAEIEVADDGVGFDPAAASVTAHGLAGMRFRVRSAQGELKIRSRTGHGTTIQARLPLDGGTEGERARDASGTQSATATGAARDAETAPSDSSHAARGIADV
jgi:signal transduction histidine kinase